jgi:hypothetical protein
MQRVEIPQALLNMPGAAAVIVSRDQVWRALEGLMDVMERDPLTVVSPFGDVVAAYRRYEEVLRALTLDQCEVTRVTLLECGDVVLKACAAAMPPRPKGN